MAQLRSFRFVCSEEEIPLLEELLKLEGFLFEEDFLYRVRRLKYEPFPLGLSVAAFFGLIYIQDRASMLPPVALNIPKNALVLDMCSSPGSKTSQLAVDIGKKGMVLANEVSASRLSTLRRNLQQMGLSQAISTCYDASVIPLQEASFPFILLDPPCSGWGTVEKNPNVMNIWKGDKTLPLIALQQKLLTEASRLLAPGASMVYSTCTTNVAENEEQVIFAENELGLVRDILPKIDAFPLEEPLLHCSGTWRISPQKGENQGFFVARFHKPEHCQPESIAIAENAPSLSKQNNMSKGRVQEKGYFLDDQELENAGIYPQSLHGGNMAVFGDNLHFVPEKSNLLAPELRWQGMYMGKVSKSGELQISPRIRLEGALPRIELEGKDGLDQIKKLLSGQSLTCDHMGKNALLYWNGLLLGRVRLKNKRYLWAER